VACAGGEPLGLTDCLNFGNPEKPEVMGQFVRAVEGMAGACRAFDVPITGGNVSLYNETDGRAIFPTPVIGVVGLLDDAEHVLRRSFVADGDAVFLLGATGHDLGGSEWLKVVHGRVAGRPPRLDLEAERSLHELLAAAAKAGVLLSAHDLSDGGLGVALAECCFGWEEPGRGGRFDLDHMVMVGGGPVLERPDVRLFAETPSRAVVTTRDEKALHALAERHHVPCTRLGAVGGDRLTITASGRTVVDASVVTLHTAWMSLEDVLAGARES
jgi:phosphoribosylformylglycinamidine synthase